MWKPNNLLFAEKSNPVTESFRAFVVPIMLFTSSLIMAIAWLGHLKFSQFPLIWAMLCSWLLVLPEYFINIVAIRLGYQVYLDNHKKCFE